jgi:predicted nucleic acid-binding Zn finger protein
METVDFEGEKFENISYEQDEIKQILSKKSSTRTSIK